MPLVSVQSSLCSFALEDTDTRMQPACPSMAKVPHLVRSFASSPPRLMRTLLLMLALRSA